MTIFRDRRVDELSLAPYSLIQKTCEILAFLSDWITIGETQNVLSLTSPTNRLCTLVHCTEHIKMASPSQPELSYIPWPRTHTHTQPHHLLHQPVQTSATCGLQKSRFCESKLNDFFSGFHFAEPSLYEFLREVRCTLNTSVQLTSGAMLENLTSLSIEVDRKLRSPSPPESQ